jgi:drug/metabolite transporter (DMT)-like permease
MVGICISFAGLLLLMLNKGAISNDEISYSALVILATVFYAANINMVSRHLQGVGSMNIAATAFTFLCLPSAIILIYTGFFQFNFRSVPVIISTGASAILGIFGTAIASVLFYMLVKRAGVLFASLITYGIHFVALFWGVIYGEPITLMQVACLSVILAGIFVSNR